MYLASARVFLFRLGFQVVVEFRESKRSHTGGLAHFSAGIRNHLQKHGRRKMCLTPSRP